MNDDQFLKSIGFKGRGIPHKRTAKRRGAEGINRLNEILRAPTPEAVSYALKIIRCLYPYESQLEMKKYSLTKALVSLCDKVFDMEVYKEAERRLIMHLAGDAGTKESMSLIIASTPSEPELDEIVVGYLCVRHRQFGRGPGDGEPDGGSVIDRRIMRRLKNVSEKLRNKALKILGGTSHGCSLEAMVNKLGDETAHRRRLPPLAPGDIHYIRENYCLVSCHFDVPGDLNIPHHSLRRSFDIAHFRDHVHWNEFMSVDVEGSNGEYKIEELGSTRMFKGTLRDLCIHLMCRRKYELKFMHEFMWHSTSFERTLMRGYMSLVTQEYVVAREHFRSSLSTLMELGMLKIEEMVLLLYDFISLSHLFCGEYFECIYYLDKAIDLSHRKRLGFVYRHFLGRKFLAERIGSMEAPCMEVKMEIPIPEGVDAIELLRSGERILKSSRLCMKLALRDERSNYRELRTLDSSKCIEPFAIASDIGRIMELYSECSILSLYSIDGILYINSFLEIVKTDICFPRVKERLSGILRKSKDVLRRRAESDTDKARWWMERTSLDDRMGELLDQVSSALPRIPLRDKVILILDETTTEFPFEALHLFRNRAVYRVTSLELLDPRPTEATVDEAFFVLDPENNLPSTQKVVGEFLRSNMLRNGVTMRIPTQSECRLADDCDLILYFGHGNGSKYLRLGRHNKVVLLFGCNSARLLCVENYKRNGSVLKYLSRGSLVLGCLWEVTDRDIDRFSIKVMESMKNKECLGSIVSRLRSEFKMRYLNGAAVVVYGAPRAIKWRQATDAH
jgi:separase